MTFPACFRFDLAPSNPTTCRNVLEQGMLFISILYKLGIAAQNYKEAEPVRHPTTEAGGLRTGSVLAPAGASQVKV